MLDTVNFRLSRLDVGGVDFIEDLPRFLENVGVHIYDGHRTISGSLKGLKVSADDNTVKVGDGSLCKYYLGDNYQTLTRSAIKKAIESLSDALHLPMKAATVTRMDVAQNFIMQYPPSVYFNHLGEMGRSKRLQQPSGLYYNLSGGQLCFYDKNKEHKAQNMAIPDLYKGRCVLRYERRYKERLAAKFGVPEVTGAMLSNEKFYIKVIDGWKADYHAIRKINDTTINFKVMKNKKDFYRMGVLALIEMMGGQMQMFTQIEEAQRRGELTRKQAHDLKKAIKEACCVLDSITVQNDAIVELTNKVDVAARFYR